MASMELVNGTHEVQENVLKVKKRSTKSWCQYETALLIKTITLKQDVENDTKTQLSDSTVSELYNIEFQNFKKSFDCYVKIVVLAHNEQKPSYDDLQEFVSDVMSEFSNMRDFDALHFFICQRCLKTIYDVLKEEDNLKFFTLLLDLNYADITWRCLKDENLLDTTAPGFTLSLIRDMMNLLMVGSNKSAEFALILAEKDAVKTFTDFLIYHKNVQNSQSNFIIGRVVAVLYTIARRKGAKKFFSVNNTYNVIQNMEFKEEDTSMIATFLRVLIEDDSTTDTEAETTAVHLLPLYELLTGGLSDDDDPDDLIFTTQCLRGLCRNKEGSEIIITDKDLNGNLQRLINSHNEDLSANVHSILWTAGRTTGILPSTTDIVLSDEFPKRFEIKPTPLGQGGFGSVHLVVDIDQPDDETFVPKKTHADPNNQKKWMESLQSEASILIKLKHKNIVQFHGYLKKENDVILFLEYIKMGTLSTFIKQHTRLNEGLTRQFTIQILEGVKYLHETNILHLDIKGTNILMVDESNIKLTDFGLSTILNEEGVEAERGTTRYMAPEMINCPEGRIFKHCCSLDIWSVGSTVVEMITGSPPNSTTASVNVLFKIAMLQKPKYELSITASKNLRDFLEKTFTSEAEQRPSAEDLLREDPFITGSL
ncbi:dual specificity protein kinase shkB-like [Physella acuta]|uniref:dual specificity protein kinase shkB-like n=1 Tax=Physella acuta TaxID=109671 RepID=UPI0027DDBA9A|nr:dual specificity protein kinase shkB-like [Physella acuta]